MNLNIQHFVDEGELVSAVAAKLGISYDESEQMYCALGGYQGHPVNFDTRWPNDDAFSVCVQEYMTANGIVSMQAQYDD